MSLKDLFFKKTVENQKEEEKKAEEIHQPSLYAQILAGMTEGELPEGFNLDYPQDTVESPRLDDGAMEGILIYHLQRKSQDEGFPEEFLSSVLEGDYTKAKEELEQFFQPENHNSMLLLTDEIQGWIFEYKNVINAEALFQFACKLMKESANPEVVKFALAVLELLPIEGIEEVCQVIRTLALSDAFSLFCIPVIRQWAHGNEELFEIAKKVKGWGRIFIVDEILPDSIEIQAWLLHDGWINTVSSNYSALICAQKGGLSSLLAHQTLFREESVVAEKLLDALLVEQPLPGLSALPEREKMVEDYLRHARWMTKTVEDYEIMYRMRNYLAESDFTNRNHLMDQCERMLNSFACRDVLIEAMQRGTGFELARILGIEYEEYALRQLRIDFFGYYHLAEMLLTDGYFAKEVISLFCKSLPLEEMADPCKEIRTEEDKRNYELLGFVLHFLGEYPTRGEDLVRCALRSPLADHRRKALDIILAWREAGFIPDVEEVLRQMRKTEKAEDILKKIDEVSRR